ncbi:MAG TPA: right-handed parallel beta-helix repeat-containing protein [Bryobacteraceae bacterium]|nr:right-handed parallel beta-helix repeat-containing protein [Bryobacteraceae bacterium]
MTRFHQALSVALFTAAVLAPGVSALGADGTILINQSTSINGLPGCQHSGFPILICQPGSYRLSGNLTVSDPNTDAIRVVISSDVWIDLNGFVIRGPVQCTGATPSCSPSNATGAGISGLSVSIANGMVTGMGFGISVEQNGRVENMQVYENGSDGIDAGDACTVANNNVYRNGGTGVLAQDGCTITGNTVYNNASDGIFANNSNVSGNTSTKNSSYGVNVDCPATLIGNTITGNGGGSFNLNTSGTGCVLVNNVAP